MLPRRTRGYIFVLLLTSLCVGREFLGHGARDAYAVPEDAVDPDNKDQEDAKVVGKRRKERAIADLEDEVRRLEETRISAAKAQNRSGVSAAVRAIRDAKDKLKQTRAKSIESFAAAGGEGQQPEVEQLAAFATAAVNSGCPITFLAKALFLRSDVELFEGTPGGGGWGGFRSPYKTSFPKGTYALVRIRSLSPANSVTAWELKIEVVDAFGKTIQSMTKQGANLNLGDEQFQLDFRYDPNAVTVRVSLERAAFSDGSTWTRRPEHRGVMRTITKTPSGTAESTDLAVPVDLPKEAAEAQPAMVREQPALAPAQPIAPENENDTLKVNKTLPMKATLVSKNGRFQLVIQDDGNLVVSRRQDGRPIWDASSAGSNAKHLLLQGDGNLVLQREDGTVAWSTNTSGKQGVKLICQVDGNLVLYTQDDVAVWASGSNE